MDSTYLEIAPFYTESLIRKKSNLIWVCEVDSIKVNIILPIQIKRVRLKKQNREVE